MSLNRQLTRATKTIVLSSGVAAGTSVQTLASVDTLGYDGYRFMVLLGTLSSGQVTTAAMNESADNATWTAVTGATTAGAVTASDAGKLLILEVFKPQMRYIQPIINRATGNAVIIAAWIELYIPNFQPTIAIPLVLPDTNISQYLTMDNPI